MRPLGIALLLTLCVCGRAVCAGVRTDSLSVYARDFWAWRAAEQPVNGDDIPRIDRPEDWRPHWTASDLRRYRVEAEAFEKRLAVLGHEQVRISDRVDHALLRSAVARVQWELAILNEPARNPAFYVDQTVTAYQGGLLLPPPLTGSRVATLARVLDSIPETLEAARSNLTDPRRPFAQLAIDQLDGAHARLLKSVAALDADVAARCTPLAEKAGLALDAYRAWLQEQSPRWKQDTAIGREAYLFFLHKVALLPYTPEELLALGRRDWAADVAGQLLEERRNSGAPALRLFATQQDQVRREASDELQVRRFITEKGLLTIPEWMPHWTFAPMPSAVAAMGDLGEADDFASRLHPGRDGVRYIEPPDSDLGYFARAMATDPRTLIVHEGIPGHYFQLELSWHNPDPIRRYYYDSGANEGIGFYAEGLLLGAGLFDDSPRSRELLWNFARLRALRVEADVKLALGVFSLEQAAEYLRTAVPMDEKTASGEASFFASTPGQAISYLVGRVQIEELLADMKRKQGDKFDLRAFQDSVWMNGNVPLVLQRWEMLGDATGLGRLQ